MAVENLVLPGNGGRNISVCNTHLRFSIFNIQCGFAIQLLPRKRNQVSKVREESLKKAGCLVTEDTYLKLHLPSTATSTTEQQPLLKYLTN